MTDPKRPIGFPVHLGSPVDDGREGEIIGLPAIRKGGGSLTIKADQPCPFCEGDLYQVPDGVIVGRIVGVEQGKVAVDLLPAHLRAVACVPCQITFYEPRA